jgi:hypothetical protein
MKTGYIACYGYGTGGVWVYPVAESAAQILERFSQLPVVTDSVVSVPSAEVASRPSGLPSGTCRTAHSLGSESRVELALLGDSPSERKQRGTHAH